MSSRPASHALLSLELLLVLIISITNLSVTVRAGSSDLTVEGIWLEDASQIGQPLSQVSLGQSFNIIATIKNIGQDTGSGYYLDVYYDSDYGRGGPDNIASGELQTWYVGPLTAQAGTHTTKWVIDPDNQIAELDETNNQKELVFTVGSQTVTTTVTSNSTSSTTESTSTTTSTTTSSSTYSTSTVSTTTSSTSHTTSFLAVTQAGVSQGYVLGFKVSDVYSSSYVGDEYISSTGWSSTSASFPVTLAEGESFFLIGSAQVWNDYASVGSSIAVCRDGVMVSGDMFAAGATIRSRELATAVAVDTPGAGTYAYSLCGKTDPGGRAAVSQGYVLGFKVSGVYSGSAVGDYYVSTTGWSSTPASFTVDLGADESLFLIGAAQVWNDYASVGSSIAICRDGVRVSGDMFAAGATITSRELATAVAVDTPGAGTFTYSLSAKTDPGGKAWASQPYVLGFKVSDVYSDSAVGDYSFSTTGWSSTPASFEVTLAEGESLFLIGASQVWNDRSSVGSSIAICRDGVRVSGDMFAAGATITSRELATAIAVDTLGTGTYTYSLSAKTD
jgi:hypothetical protein